MCFEGSGGSGFSGLGFGCLRVFRVSDSGCKGLEALGGFQSLVFRVWKFKISWLKDPRFLRV